LSFGYDQYIEINFNFDNGELSKIRLLYHWGFCDTSHPDINLNNNLILLTQCLVTLEKCMPSGNFLHSAISTDNITVWSKVQREVERRGNWWLWQNLHSRMFAVGSIPQRFCCLWKVVQKFVSLTLKWFASCF